MVGSGGGGFFPLLQGGCCGSTSQDQRKLFRPLLPGTDYRGVFLVTPPPFLLLFLPSWSVPQSSPLGKKENFSPVSISGFLHGEGRDAPT